MLFKIKLTFFILASALAFNAAAQTVVDEVWTCKLKEGKEIEDVMKANAEWVKLINSSTDVGEIKSATVTPLVGDQDHFVFVDSYPDRAAWAAADDYQDSEAGQAAFAAIEAQFDALFDCSENRLYKFTPN